jgi:hypothetical protein
MIAQLRKSGWEPYPGNTFEARTGNTNAYRWCRNIRFAPNTAIAPDCGLVHHSPMRTSITLDEDVYQLASLYAKGRGVTLGAAISEMVRKGAAAPLSGSPPPNLVRAPNGLLIFAPQGRIITSEMVKEALEEDDE